MLENLAMIKEFARDRSVASVWKTPEKTAEIICDFIPEYDYKTIIELGAGLGPITKSLQIRLGKNSKLIAIEKNKRFYKSLLKKFGSDERISLYNRSASNLQQILEEEKLTNVDYIVSGIPFSILKPWEIDAILPVSQKALDSKGVFIAYQIRNKVEIYLKRFFSHVESHNLKDSTLKVYKAWG